MTNLIQKGQVALEDCAAERVMLERVLDTALMFYKEPKNLQAFNAWLKNKEEKTHVPNSNHD